MSTINWVPGLTLEEVEKACILQAFRWFRGNKTQTSIALGVSVKTIDNKLEKYEQDGKAAKEQNDHDELKRKRDLNRMRGLPEDAPSEGQGPKNVFSTDSGLHVEPAPQARPEPAVPVSQRQEIQKVLPTHASASSQRGRR